MALMCPHDLTTNSSHSPFVVSASSFFSGTSSNPFHAFDADVSSGATDLARTWLGTGGGVDWLQLDTGGSFVLGAYSIVTNSSADVVVEQGRAPKNWTIQGSNNGSTWTTLDTQTNQTAWTSGGQIRRYNIASPGATTYRYFRINITANNGDATYTGISELYLFPPITTGELGPHDLAYAVDPSGVYNAGSVHGPFAVTASSFFVSAHDADPYHAFDGDSSKEWLGQGSGTDWLKIDLGATAVLGSYRVEVGTTANRAPKNWTMQGSNDNSTWATLDTQTNQTAWSSGTGGGRTFTVSGVTTAYRYYKLNITANNGDTTYTSIAELYLYAGTILTDSAQPQIFVIC